MISCAISAGISMESFTRAVISTMLAVFRTLRKMASRLAVVRSEPGGGPVRTALLLLRAGLVRGGLLLLLFLGLLRGLLHLLRRGCGLLLSVRGYLRGLLLCGLQLHDPRLQPSDPCLSVFRVVLRLDRGDFGPAGGLRRVLRLRCRGLRGRARLRGILARVLRLVQRRARRHGRGLIAPAGLRDHYRHARPPPVCPWPCPRAVSSRRTARPARAVCADDATRTRSSAGWERPAG